MSWTKYWDSSSNINNNILKKWSEYYCEGINKLDQLNIEDIVLDFGAGSGEISKYISTKVKSVIAYDTSVVMNKLCHESTVGCTNVTCTTELRNHEDISCVLINSVLQYLDDDELSKVLNFITNETVATKIIISDIIPVDYSAYRDAANNLLYSFKNKFFLSYLLFLMNEFFKRILLHRSLVLNEHNKNQLIIMLNKRGWNIELVDNLSPSINRYSLFCYRHF